MRYAIATVLTLLTFVLLATFTGGFFFTTFGVVEAFHNPFMGIFMSLGGVLLMGLACFVSHDFHLVEWNKMQCHLIWRWMRQEDRIAELESRIRDLDSRLGSAIDEACSHWENGAELSRDYNVLEGQHTQLQKENQELRKELLMWRKRYFSLLAKRGAELRKANRLVTEAITRASRRA